MCCGLSANACCSSDDWPVDSPTLATTALDTACHPVHSSAWSRWVSALAYSVSRARRKVRRMEARCSTSLWTDFRPAGPERASVPRTVHACRGRSPARRRQRAGPSARRRARNSTSSLSIAAGGYNGSADEHHRTMSLQQAGKGTVAPSGRSGKNLSHEDRGPDGGPRRAKRHGSEREATT